MKAKREALKSLFTAVKERKVDGDITALLMLINSIRGIYTTSSCSGRIGIIEEPAPGAKPLARWLIKVHRPIEFWEAKESLKKASRGIIFLKSQPPIFHVVAEDLERAKRLHELGLASGFKYTTFKAIGRRYLVEINATEYLTVPLGKDGNVLVSDEYLRFAVEIGNGMLKRSKGRLPRLERNFMKLREELGEDELFHEIKEEFRADDQRISFHSGFP
ncbi:tRNA(Phe) 7-((3-amino-3-carboxypropyl)-4-demethylwyosine(37)-N(4))-methyltransferase Taw3 [Thermococcus sp.]